MEQLKGKKAIITGGSEGIGFAIAESFVKNGADVLIISRDKENCPKLWKCYRFIAAPPNIYPLIYPIH